MRTKDECFERIMEIVDMVAATGFFTDEELAEIDKLEFEYYAQTEKEERALREFLSWD